jgi:hypothetical protein
MTMTNLPARPTAAWYADGLDWLGAAFNRRHDFDRPSFAPSSRAPRDAYLPPEEFLFDVRTRMLAHL